MKPKRTSLSRWSRKIDAALHTHEDVEFHLVEQPPRSPDTNVLDLGFFASLQARAWKLKRAKDIDGLIDNVLKAWDDYDPITLNRIWLSHQACMQEIIVHNGANDYKVPHQQKRVLEREGRLPTTIPLHEDAITSYVRFQNN
eukprot:scaffold7181_cov146-Amphora_coffeaeformis.AAC.3